MYRFVTRILCTIDMSKRLLTKTSTHEKSEFREWFVGCVLSKTNISSFLQQSTCKNKSKPTVINPCIYQRLGLFSFFFFFLQNNFRFVRSNFDNVYLQDPNAALPAMGFDQSLLYVYCDVSILWWLWQDTKHHRIRITENKQYQL